MSNKILQILQVGNIIAVILTIIVNALANILPIGGKYTGELSDNIPNLFVPAGITFAIWGIIYVLIIIFAIYLAKDIFQKEKTTKQLRLTNNFNSRKAGCLKQYPLYRNPGFSLDKCLFDY